MMEIGGEKHVVSIDREVLQAIADAMQADAWLVSIHSRHNKTIHHRFVASNRFPPADFRACADKLREDGYNRLRQSRKLNKRTRRHANDR